MLSLAESQKASSIKTVQSLLKVGSSALLGNIAASSSSLYLGSGCSCVYHDGGADRNGLLSAAACSCRCVKCKGSGAAGLLPAANAAEIKWYNPERERIFDTLHKSYVPAMHPPESLANDLADKTIITVGEVHSNPIHHKVEFEVIRSLANIKSPETMAIGLECFYRQHQRALNRFVFMHQDMGILKTETNWDETWGYDLNYYAKIFNFAAKNKIRLIGLNVPIQVTKLVSAVGFEQLPGQIKKLMPEVDFNVESHLQYFVQSMRGSTHMSESSESFRRMYEAQTLWDEYMAESASNYIRQFPKSTLVVLAGLGHVIGRASIPDRIEKRVQSAPFVIVPQQVDWNENNGLPLIDQPLTQQDCDWAWYTQREIA